MNIHIPAIIHPRVTIDTDMLTARDGMPLLSRGTPNSMMATGAQRLRTAYMGIFMPLSAVKASTECTA